MIFIFCWTLFGVVILHVMIRYLFSFVRPEFSQLQLKISVFSYVLLHSLVDLYKHFWGTCCPKYQVKWVSHMERISKWHRNRQTSAWAKREPAHFPDHQGGNRDWATMQEPELEELLRLSKPKKPVSEGTHYELGSLTWPLPGFLKIFSFRSLDMVFFFSGSHW